MQAIGQLKTVILEKAETHIIADRLDQDNLSFEIITITREEQRVYLYHATLAGVENCTIKVTEFQAVLDWYCAQGD